VARARRRRGLGSVRGLRLSASSSAVRAGLCGALRVGLAALFLYAGIAKIVDVRTFATDVAHYRVVPALLVAPFAAALPGIEVACGVGLLFGRTARAGALLAAGLLAVFTAAAVQALARDINIDCGCFGSIHAPVTLATVVRDFGLLGAALIVAVLAPTDEKAPRAGRPGG
jgi:putative oxidoreductase